MEAGRPPGPGAGVARGPAADRPGTGGPEGGPNAGGGAARGGPTPRGIEADPAERGRRDAGGPWPTPERAGDGARWNAGDNPRPKRAAAAWHRGGCRRRGGDGARAGRGRRRNGRAAAEPEGGRPFSPPSLPFGNFSRRPSPPTDSWGRRPPRGGHDARLLRARMALGRRQAPCRPHDAGRPGEGRRRYQGLSPAGPWRAALARGRWPISGLGGPGLAWHRATAQCARVSGIFGSHPILGNVARQGFGRAGDNPLSFQFLGTGPGSGSTQRR